jgi:hypothetical protein
MITRQISLVVSSVTPKLEALSIIGRAPFVVQGAGKVTRSILQPEWSIQYEIGV